jgi:lysophospholipase L1-like esterase
MKKRVICFGDSNTWGYIPVTGQRYDETIRWPARLQEKLGYKDYTVVEEGLTGRTTVFDDPFDPELNGLKTMPAILRSAAPIDMLVFMLGTNDFQSNIPAGNPISTARAVQYMLETARSLGVDRPGEKMKILLISPVEITEDRLTFKENDVTDQTSINNSRELGKHLRIVADQLGVEFIDAAKYIKPGKVDGVHLDEAGHAKMAELVYEMVHTMLP